MAAASTHFTFGFFDGDPGRTAGLSSGDGAQPAPQPALAQLFTPAAAAPRAGAAAEDGGVEAAPGRAAVRPPPERLLAHVRAEHARVRVLDDARGGVRLVAACRVRKGDVLAEASPVLCIRTLEDTERGAAVVCSRCCAHIGGAAEQLGAQLGAWTREAALAPEALAEALPSVGGAPTASAEGARAVRCARGCRQLYCGTVCARADWRGGHALLCTGGELSAAHPLREHARHARRTSETFLLGARCFAAALARRAPGALGAAAADADADEAGAEAEDEAEGEALEDELALIEACLGLPEPAALSRDSHEPPLPLPWWAVRARAHAGAAEARAARAEAHFREQAADSFELLSAGVSLRAHELGLAPPRAWAALLEPERGLRWYGGALAALERCVVPMEVEPPDLLHLARTLGHARPRTALPAAEASEPAGGAGIPGGGRADDDRRSGGHHQSMGAWLAAVRRLRPLLDRALPAPPRPPGAAAHGAEGGVSADATRGAVLADAEAARGGAEAQEAARPPKRARPSGATAAAMSPPAAARGTAAAAAAHTAAAGETTAAMRIAELVEAERDAALLAALASSAPAELVAPARALALVPLACALPHSCAPCAHLEAISAHLEAISAPLPPIRAPTAAAAPAAVPADGAPAPAPPARTAGRLGRARGVRACLVALQDLWPGQELTVAKVSGAEAEAARRAALRERDPGAPRCACARCAFERGGALPAGAARPADGADGGVRSAAAATARDLARAALADGRFDDAEACMAAWLALEPQNGDAHYALGAQRVAAGRWRAARAAWRDGLRAAPAHPNLCAAAERDRLYLAPPEEPAPSEPRGGPAPTAVACTRLWPDATPVSSCLARAHGRAAAPRRRPGAVSSREPAVAAEAEAGSVGGGRVLLTAEPVASAAECGWLIAQAEAAAAAAGGWTTARHYAVPTTDLPLHTLREPCGWFARRCRDTLFPLLAAHFGVRASDMRVHDAFVVKYTAAAQRLLPLHTDEAQISLTLALNPSREYDGGGTYFAHARAALAPERGHALLFDSALLHGGDPVVRGVRYIIAAFLCVDDDDGEGARAR